MGAGNPRLKSSGAPQKLLAQKQKPGCCQYVVKIVRASESYDKALDSHWGLSKEPCTEPPGQSEGKDGRGEMERGGETLVHLLYFLLLCVRTPSCDDLLKKG